MLRISVNSCRSLLKLNIKQNNNTNRSLHLICRTRRTVLKNSRILDSHPFDSHILSAFFVRHASTIDTTVDVTKEQSLYRIDLTGKVDDLPPIPDVPTPIPDVEVLQKLHPNGEVAFESLGLGGYGPVGIIQSTMEWLHINCELPWWGAIALGTLVVRFMMFPLVISSQRHSAIMSKYMPKIQQIQQNLTEARTSGNEYEAAMYTNELYILMKEKGIGPWKSMRTIVIQAPLFISFFMALRGMANLPVESLKTGGLWWFTDLTVPDPYYILPLITATTLFITIEVGTDTAGAVALGNMRYFLRCIPLFILPASIGFPSAILCYWTLTNFISLAQVGLLRIPRVREALELPERVKHKPEVLGTNKGFVKGFKESWDNMKVTKQLADRERSDMAQFNEAGRSPIIKTYKYDPTKQSDRSVSLKKKL